MKKISSVLLLILILSIDTLLLNAQWIKQNSGTNEKLTGVVMLDNKTAIAIGRGRSILRTTDAGNTWADVTAMYSSVVPWNSVAFFDAANGIAAGDNGQVRTTTDSGKTWYWRTIPDGRKCISAFQLFSDRMWVGTDSGWIYESKDSGKTWTSEKLSNEPIRAIFSYLGPTTDYLPVYAITPHSFFSKEDHYFGKWKESSNFFPGLGSEAFDGEIPKGGGHTFIAGVSGDKRAAPTVLRDSMFHVSGWENVSKGILKDGTFYGLSAPEHDVVYACGTGGMIYKSFDEETTWKEQNVPVKQNLNDICFFDENNGFAVGDSGVILHTTNGGVNINDSSSGSSGYYPLSIGNKWVFQGYYNDWIWPYNLEVTREVIDTATMNNDKLYFKIKETWSDYHPPKTFLERIDTNQSKIFRYNSNSDSTDYEDLLEDLNTAIGDTVKGFRFISEYYLREYWHYFPKFYYEGDTILFKHSTHIKAYQSGYLLTWRYYLAKDFGLIYVGSGDDNRIFEYGIKGAVINGVVYGDTSRIYTGINEKTKVPVKFSLSQNYPNPFNPTTRIKYELPNESEVKLSIYNMLGEEITVLVNKQLKAGRYEVEWNANKFASGVYFYQIQYTNEKGNRQITTKKMIYIK